MKKIYYKLILLLLISNFNQAQTNTTFTLESFKINLVESPSGVAFVDTYADIKWDFNLVNKDTSLTKIYIEIAPIMDCWNKLDAKDIKKTMFVELKNKSAKKNNTYRIKHVEIGAKCFKWRIRFEGKQINQMSDWNYHLFIK